MRSHGASRAISSIERCATPAAALERSPAGLACEDGVVEAVEGAGACAVDERGVTEERDVIEAEVPDRSVHHAVGAEGHESSNDGTGEDVVPGCQSVLPQAGSEWGGTCQLWYSSMVRAPPIKQAPRTGA